MRDAVPLIGKHVVVGETLFRIEDFYYVPGNKETYVKLYNEKGKYWLNYELSKLREFIEDQITL
jgi:hypothetical protein